MSRLARKTVDYDSDSSLSSEDGKFDSGGSPKRNIGAGGGADISQDNSNVTGQEASSTSRYEQVYPCSHMPPFLTAYDLCPRHIQEDKQQRVHDTSTSQGESDCVFRDLNIEWHDHLKEKWPGLTLDEACELEDIDYKWNNSQLHERMPGRGPELTETEGRRWAELMRKNIDYLDDIHKRRKNKKKHGSYELGPREFTLTYSPSWYEEGEVPIDNQARIEMIKAIEKLFAVYYVNEVTEWRAVGEVGKNGLSHIHCYYHLEGGKKITDKNFKRAWPYWNPKKKIGKGFEGGHHETVKNTADFLGYIEEDIPTGTVWYDAGKTADPS